MTETTNRIVKALEGLENEKEGIPPYDIEGIRETKNIMEGLETQKKAESSETTQQFLGRCAIRLQEGINVYTKARFAKIIELKSKSKGPLKQEIKRNFSPSESEFLSDYIKTISLYKKAYGFDPTSPLRPPRGLTAECVVIKDTGGDPIAIGSKWVNLKVNEILSLLVQDAEELESLGFVKINMYLK
ncbi:hypothetical protein TVAG_172450 [Trichomonas vaginalis G3]|uniref:GINS subunit domain-containing protein n=1 Tax=Trichomonas vaginalis (strain ATCC PRA-98 / G3) TaxID=412133 RepID=A2DEZ6_TRIV3|nr:GINS helical bundle-like family [Trichomonas vaginalis G3]EAY20988.1 hypothetical protein TVAG_172450 [Trichomonas vaginalis G3]KAI5519159.1 GINS helical bundle-like family [Trichomonas vaginalis G3]|eukprot:XP_001581974.1 hypothetical protein [Trichomonas vaginalis G3]